MSRFLPAAVLILALGIISLAILIHTQNTTIVALSQTMESMSANVYEIVKQKSVALQQGKDRAVAKMSNPASQNCIGLGGKLNIEKRPDGGEFGVCSFGSNMECEEWALMRGECAQGGVDVSATKNPADRFCLISGNTLSKPGDVQVAGTCNVDGHDCSAQVYYETGECK